MKLQEKQMIHGFAVDRSRYVPELHSQAYELHHVQSGARLLYIQNDDDNKVFSISFRTNACIVTPPYVLSDIKAICSVFG